MPAGFHFLLPPRFSLWYKWFFLSDRNGQFQSPLYAVPVELHNPDFLEILIELLWYGLLIGVTIAIYLQTRFWPNG